MQLTPICPGSGVTVQGAGRRTSIHYPFSQQVINKLLPAAGHRGRHGSVVTSNPVHKLEELTQVGVRDVPTDRPDQRTMGGNEGEQDGHPLSLADSPSAQCSCWESEGRAGVRSHVCGVTLKSGPSSDRALVPVQTLTPRARLKFSRPMEHSLALNPTITSSNAREFLTLLIGRALGKWRTRGKRRSHT